MPTKPGRIDGGGVCSSHLADISSPDTCTFSGGVTDGPALASGLTFVALHTRPVPG